VLVVDLDGNVIDGEGAPSSEKNAHFAAYRARPDVGAVIHSHSIYASALAVAGEELPPIIDEQVIALGGPVKVTEYAMSATPDLGRNAVDALGERRAVLLRNHGVLGVGKDLEEVINVVTLVERVAQTYILAKLAGSARPLPDDIVRLQLKFYRMLKGLPAQD
jgi:L-fuculose-phosphate aldolase